MPEHGRRERDSEPQVTAVGVTGTAGAAQTMPRARAWLQPLAPVSCGSRGNLGWADTERHGQASPLPLVVIPRTPGFSEGEVSGNRLQLAFW